MTISLQLLIEHLARPTQLKQKENSGKDPLETNHANDHSTEQKLNLEFNGTDLVGQNPTEKVDEAKL